MPSSHFPSTAHQALSDRLAEEGWTRSMLAQLCEIRLLPETDWDEDTIEIEGVPV